LRQTVYFFMYVPFIYPYLLVLVSSFLFIIPVTLMKLILVNWFKLTTQFLPQMTTKLCR